MPDDRQSGKTQFTESELPDARLIEDEAGRSLPCPVIAIGASAGGVEALQRLFRSLPSNRGASYIVVVHLSPDHPSHLAEILANTTPLSVLQVLGETSVEPDTVYVIPPHKTT